MPLDGTLYEDETLRVLRAAQELIRDPENWCQGNGALNASGNLVVWGSPHAVQFCTYGAVRASGSNRAAIDLLDRTAKEQDIGSCIDLNDSTDHPTVMAMFDRAQELRRAEIMETVHA